MEEYYNKGQYLPKWLLKEINNNSNSMPNPFKNIKKLPRKLKKKISKKLSSCEINNYIPQILWLYTMKTNKKYFNFLLKLKLELDDKLVKEFTKKYREDIEKYFIKSK